MLMMSPAAADSLPPEAAVWSMPFSTVQPSLGKSGPLAERQPLLERPSKSSFQPSAFSESVRLLSGIFVRAMLRHWTVVPALASSLPMPWTWKAMKPFM